MKNRKVEERKEKWKEKTEANEVKELGEEKN